MGRVSIDITGQVFGTMTVIGKSTTTDNSKYLRWQLECQCGGIGYATYSDLMRGRSNYCPDCRDVKAVWSPVRALYASYKRNAEKSGRDFALTKGQFSNLLDNDCFYCDSPPMQTYSKKGMRETLTYNGIDRVDNSKGYTLDNVVTACKFCNFAKNVGDAGEFELWLDRVAMSRMQRKGIL